MKSGDEKVFNLIADKLEEINYSAKVFEYYLAAILPRVTIVQDSVITAGMVFTQNIPSDSVI